MDASESLVADRPDPITRSLIFTALVFAPIVAWTTGAVALAVALGCVSWCIGWALFARGFSWQSVGLGGVLLLPLVGVCAGWSVASVFALSVNPAWLMLGGGLAGGMLMARLMAIFGRGTYRLSLFLYAPILFVIPGYITLLYAAISDPDL